MRVALTQTDEEPDTDAQPLMLRLDVPQREARAEREAVCITERLPLVVVVTHSVCDCEGVGDTVEHSDVVGDFDNLRDAV